MILFNLLILNLPKQIQIGHAHVAKFEMEQKLCNAKLAKQKNRILLPSDKIEHSKLLKINRKQLVQNKTYQNLLLRAMYFPGCLADDELIVNY
jgi:hypothetical protein